MKKILLVEDDTFMQDIVSQKLLEASFDIKIVARGDEAVATVSDYQPDLILLDIDLPGKNGFTILQELRATDTTTPVIIFSNDDDPDNKQKAKELGAQDFYFKAYTGTDELLAKIQEHLPQ